MPKKADESLWSYLGDPHAIFDDSTFGLGGHYHTIKIPVSDASWDYKVTMDPSIEKPHVYYTEGGYHIVPLGNDVYDVYKNDGTLSVKYRVTLTPGWKGAHCSCPQSKFHKTNKCKHQNLIETVINKQTVIKTLGSNVSDGTLKVKFSGDILNVPSYEEMKKWAITHAEDKKALDEVLAEAAATQEESKTETHEHNIKKMLPPTDPNDMGF